MCRCLSLSSCHCSSDRLQPTRRWINVLLPITTIFPLHHKQLLSEGCHLCLELLICFLCARLWSVQGASNVDWGQTSSSESSASSLLHSSSDDDDTSSNPTNSSPSEPEARFSRSENQRMVRAASAFLQLSSSTSICASCISSHLSAS